MAYLKNNFLKEIPMKYIQSVIIICGCFLLFYKHLYAQKIDLSQAELEPVGVSMEIVNYRGQKSVKVIKSPDIKGPDQPTFVKITGSDFKNGVIEARVLSDIAKDAPAMARGFIGVAFRINEDNSKFEGMYLRPKNARSANQLRRNHSVQYFSYPGNSFRVLRKKSPGKYESYEDLSIGKWIKIKIEVKDAQAKLFIDDDEHPCLIVNDLKHGANTHGTVGFWVDGGTEGYFRDLVINKEM